MKIDNILKDIQLNLIKLTNEIQKQRELRLKVKPTKRKQRDQALLETSQKLLKLFEELGIRIKNETHT